MTGFRPDEHIFNKKEQFINSAPDLKEKYEHFKNDIENDQLFLHQLDLKNLLSVLDEGILSYSKLMEKLSGDHQHYQKEYKKDGPQWQERTVINTANFVRDLLMMEGLKIGDRFRFNSHVDPKSIFSEDEVKKITLDHKLTAEFRSLLNASDEKLEQYAKEKEIDIKSLKLSLSVLPIFLNKITNYQDELQIENEQELNNLKEYIQAIKEQYEKFNPRFRFFMEKEFSNIDRKEAEGFSREFRDFLEPYFGVNLVSATPAQGIKLLEEHNMKNYGQVQIFFDEPVKERQNPLKSAPGWSLPADHGSEGDVGIAGAVTPRHFHAISLGDYDVDNNILYVPKNNRYHRGETVITDEYVEALASKLGQFQDKGVLIMDREKNIPIDIKKIAIKVKEDYYQKDNK